MNQTLRTKAMVMPKAAPPRADESEIRRALGLLLEPGQVAELRVLNTQRATVSGYFNDFERLAQAASANSGKAPGVYVTLNPVNPDLLARANNRVREYARETTADKDIMKRRWFPIDFDAVRPAGISSTGGEHEAALARARECRTWLQSQDWPAAVFSDSGNGAHLLYRVDLPGDDNRLIERCLKALAARFDDAVVVVDSGNHNPARIWKIYGTVVAKGDNVPERPHRLACILDRPEMIPVSLDKLEALAATPPGIATRSERSESRRGAQPFDLDRWIGDHGLIVTVEKPGGDGRVLVLAACPFNPDHNDRSAVITESGDGTIGFKCHHNSCEGTHWRDVRELLEPGAYRGGSGGQNGHTPANEPGDGLPIIQSNYRQVREISEDCVDALARANNPEKLFVRGGTVVRVRSDEKSRPIIDDINESMLAGRLTRTADFIRVTQKGVRPCPPPQEVVRDVLAMERWPFPALAGVVEVPTLRPDGSILTTPGFDKSTGLMYLPDPSLTVPQIPEYPSVTDIQQAVAIVDDVLFDFPFVDQASRANAWAVLLTTMIRHAIQGRVPLCLCDAPKSGTGKGLLAGVVSIIATGRSASMFSAPKKDENEWRKQITSALMAGTTVIIIDNLEGRLDSASLSRALTAPQWTDRLLQTNTMVHLPNKATWLATGNNIELGGDMPRRCFLVRMDARQSKPWERTGFRHARLEEYVTKHRGELVAALLAVIRGWYEASCPLASVPPFGGFEAWAETTGGILAYAGVEGFLANLPDLHAHLDQDTPVWAAFFEAWYDVLGEVPVTVAMVTESLKANEDFREKLPDHLKGELAELLANRKQGFNQKLGGALRARKDSVFADGLQLSRASDDPHMKVGRWAVMKLKSAGTLANSPGAFEPTAGSRGEQLHLLSRNEQTKILSTDTDDRAPRNSPRSCLEPGEISEKSPQDAWDVIDDEIGI